MVISELQIALLGAGAAAVVGVWGYNAWQERKHKRAAAQIFKQAGEDPLLDGAEPVAVPELLRREPVERLEPTEPMEPMVSLTTAEASGATAATASEIPSGPVSGPFSGDEAAAEPSPQAVPTSEAAAVPATAPITSLPPLPVEFVDPAADCIIRLAPVPPAAADTVRRLQDEFAGHLGKPLVWFGWDASRGQWARLGVNAYGEYAHWVAALQLVDRRGGIAALELGRFIDGMALLAERIGSAVELPAVDGIVRQAIQLDQFCAGVDVQISLFLVEPGGGAFSGTKLRGMAEAAGLILAEDGRFHYRDADGAELFVVAQLNGERLTAETIRAQAIAGLGFTLDVPHTPHGVQAFDRMLAIAQQLARGLGGVVVDAQRQPLAETVSKTIRATVGERQQRMSEAGLAPGSELARRLFS